MECAWNSLVLEICVAHLALCGAPARETSGDAEKEVL